MEYDAGQTDEFQMPTELTGQRHVSSPIPFTAAASHSNGATLSGG